MSSKPKVLSRTEQREALIRFYIDAQLAKEHAENMIESAATQLEILGEVDQEVPWFQLIEKHKAKS